MNVGPALLISIAIDIKIIKAITKDIVVAKIMGTGLSVTVAIRWVEFACLFLKGGGSPKSAPTRKTTNPTRRLTRTHTQTTRVVAKRGITRKRSCGIPHKQ